MLSDVVPVVFRKREPLAVAVIGPARCVPVVVVSGRDACFSDQRALLGCFRATADWPPTAAGPAVEVSDAVCVLVKALFLPLCEADSVIAAGVEIAGFEVGLC